MITNADIIGIICKTFETNQTNIADAMGYEKTEITKFKNGKFSPLRNNKFKQELLEKVFKNYTNQNNSKELLEVLKNIIEESYSNVRVDMTDCWGEDNYENFVKLLLKRASVQKNKESIEHNTVAKIFEKILREHQIDMFIDEIDPTNMMNDRWLDKYNEFIENIKLNILEPYEPIKPNKPNIVYLKIHEFVQELNDYMYYLGTNMRPIEKSDWLVPLYRDENVKWAMSFNNEVENYRRKLISIYKEICSYIQSE